MDREIRSKGIGGSEVAAILGVSEWSSPYQVWLDKTGRNGENMDNKYMYAGRLLESAVAKYFASETGYRVIKSSAVEKTYQHPKYPFVIGTPDRTYFAKNLGKGVLECKTTQRRIDDVPMSWFTQLQWYLGLLELTNGSVAWLERGVDFGYKEYEFDRSFWEYALNAVGEFWENNVLKDIPPDPINVEDVEAIFSRHTEGKVYFATPDMVVNHQRIRTLIEAIKELESERDGLVEKIKLEMQDAEAIMYNEYPLFTWKTPKESFRIDGEKLKEMYPDAYNDCLTRIKTTRRFLIK